MSNVAILIDAENVLPIFADQIFTHAASLGAVTHKEIFGAAAALNAWVEPVLKYAIRPSLTIRPSKYKNTSDIALVIGAMDLLTGKTEAAPDIMVIASSDSDFSALSVRLRTGGVDVVGMGTDKSNELWRTACTSFVVLQQPSARAASQPRKAEPARPVPEKKPERTPEKTPEKAPEKPKITPTHSGRIANIRAFILNQLSSREGRMPSHALFSLLNELPDYRYDQQRSKRKPLDYLARQMGGALKIEEAEGGTWVSAAAPEAPETPEAVQEAPQPEQEMPEAPDAPEALETPEKPAPAREPEPAPQPEPRIQEPDPIALLIQAGAPEDAARKIAAICTESTDRRAVYNKLRKAFGTADARKYLQILKEAAGEA